jgi:two-component sensor histidine kinase
LGTHGQVENLLIAELKHRLAGSFQLLQAVIHIRLKSASDPESRRHLSWLLDVVTALSMLQQRIGVGAPTDFGAYLIETASYWRRICEGRAIGITLQVDSVLVSESEASTLALVAHELIANAVEHAFPEGRPGSITVQFRRCRDGARELIVRDDGQGLQPSQGAGDRQGLELVKGLADHLGGQVGIEADLGVAVRVTIPETPLVKPH